MTSRPRTRIPSRPVWGCDRLVIRAKVIENQIMADSASLFSSDSSDESVGSPPSSRILLLLLLSFLCPLLGSTTLVASPTGLCGLDPYSGSDSDSPDEVSSLEHISPLPIAISFTIHMQTDLLMAFLIHILIGPPSQDPYYVAKPCSVGVEGLTITYIINDMSFLYALPVTYCLPPGIPSTIHDSYPTREGYPFGLASRHASPHSSDQHSSFFQSTSDSSPVNSLGFGCPDQGRLEDGRSVDKLEGQELVMAEAI
ncbi:hypothetical protein Tco_0846861 [Tanacetum coccineum]